MNKTCAHYYFIYGRKERMEQNNMSTLQYLDTKKEVMEQNKSTLHYQGTEREIKEQNQEVRLIFDGCSSY